MGVMASRITGVLIVFSTVCSSADQKKHQSSASLAFARGIHRWPVDSPCKGPVTRKMFPFGDAKMGKRNLSRMYMFSNNISQGCCRPRLCCWSCVALRVPRSWGPPDLAPTSGSTRIRRESFEASNWPLPSRNQVRNTTHVLGVQTRVWALKSQSS